MVIVDVSVALKWTLDEDETDIARRLSLSEDMAAPDFLLLESANVLAMKVRRGLLSAEGARLGQGILASAPVRFLPSKAYVSHAQQLAMDLRQTAYDCLYLASAIAEEAVLISADYSFVDAVSAHPVLASRVSRLDAWTSS